MRRAAKVDANHASLVAALRDLGCSVQSLAAIGKGCPDLLVGFRQVNYLFEVKDPANAPSKRRLTKDQVPWHDDWCGRVHVIETIDDALRVMR